MIWPSDPGHRGFWRAIWATAALALASVASHAEAQEAHSGISLSLKEIYDSNVARSDEATALLRHIIRQDELFTPSVDLDLAKSIGRQKLFVLGTVGYTSYTRNSFLNSQHIDLTAGGTATVASCHGTVTGHVAEFQSDLQDLNLVQVKNIETRQSIKIDTDCARPIGLTPTFSVSESNAVNSATARRPVNNRTFETEGGIAYSRPNLGQLAMFGRYSITQYPNLIVLNVPAGFVDRNISYAGGFRFSRQVSTKLGGSVELSYTRLQPNTPGASGFSGLTYVVSVYVKPSRRLGLDLNAQRATLPSNILGSTVSTSQTYSGDVVYTLGKFDLKIGASRAIQRYGAGLAIVPISRLTIDQQTVNAVFGSIETHIARKFLLNLNARVENRRTNILELDYTDVRSGVTATATF